MKKILYIMFVVLFLSACASTGSKTTNNQASQDLTSQQLSQEIQNIQKSKDYLLHAGDLVEVKVYMEESMDRTLRISTNGTITFPLVGNIKIANLTISQAEKTIENRLKKYIKMPSVSMLIQEYANKTVYVLGQVKKPTSIAIPPEKPLTVLEAITSAGGFTDVASPSRVKVLRMKNGKQESIEVDVSQITKEGNKALDIELEPSDVVFIPQSLF